jgi:hypothetical protein
LYSEALHTHTKETEYEAIVTLQFVYANISMQQEKKTKVFGHLLQSFVLLDDEKKFKQR